MLLLFALLLSIPQPLPRLTTEYRQIGPYRTDTSVNDNGDRLTFFEATIRDREGRQWVGYGMDLEEAEANAKRHYQTWSRR